MNRLPEAVRKQQEEADRKIAEFKKQQESGATAEPQTPVEPPQKPETPPAAPAPNAEPPPQTNAEPQKSEQQQALEAIEAEEQTFKGRYKTLSGKYVAEVPRLQAEVRQLNDIVARLKQDLDATRRQPPPASPQTVPPPAKPLVSEEEVETFGDVVKVSERIAREAAQEQAAAQGATIQSETQRVYGQLQGDIRQMRHQAMLRDLDTLKPGWRETNKDALFLAWLGEIDPLSGEVRQGLLDRAEEAFDAQRVANILTSFESDMKTNSTGPANAGNPVAPPSLESQVTPRNRGPQVPTTAPNKKVWKASELKEAANDITRGVYRKSPEALKKLLTEMDQAIAEGRVLIGQ